MFTRASLDFEIDFMDVGDSHGDAICVRWGNEFCGYFVHVIDGGYPAIGEKVIAHLNDHWHTNTVNWLSVTHGDSDHTGGSVRIIEECDVGLVLVNRPWEHVEEVIQHYHGNYGLRGLAEDLRDANQSLLEIEEVVARRPRTRITCAFQGDAHGCMKILAPSRRRYIDLIPKLRGPEAINLPDSYARRPGQNVLAHGYESWDHETLQEFPTPPTSASNETSLIQMASFDNFHAVFTGDAGPQGLIEANIYARNWGIYRRPTLFQIPHQGSRRNVTPTSLDLWLGPRLPVGSQMLGWAACTVGATKQSHPRKTVTNALLRRGYPTQVTRGDVMRYTNRPGSGWYQVPPVPFHNYIAEAEAA